MGQKPSCILFVTAVINEVIQNFINCAIKLMLGKATWDEMFQHTRRQSDEMEPGAVTIIVLEVWPP